MSTLTLAPAYGRDYRSQADIVVDLVRDKDFLLCDPQSRWYGKPVNRSQLVSMEPGLYDPVINVRYDKLRKVALIDLRKLGEHAVRIGSRAGPPKVRTLHEQILMQFFDD